jgi:predicted transcriptional regulator
MASETEHPLRCCRVKLGLTQEALATKAKVTQPIVSRIERGLGAGRGAALAIWKAIDRRVPLAVLLGEEASARSTR